VNAHGAGAGGVEEFHAGFLWKSEVEGRGRFSVEKLRKRLLKILRGLLQRPPGEQKSFGGFSKATAYLLS
jgi:hypothetical protein